MLSLDCPARNVTRDISEMPAGEALGVDVE
jgi:hypothetical protein